MQPAAGDRLVRYVGDRLRFTLTGTGDRSQVYLRTNIGRAAELRQGVIRQIRVPEVQVEASWRDVPMRHESDAWVVEFALAEVGWFQAKAYVVNEAGNQRRPFLSIHG